MRKNLSEKRISDNAGQKMEKANDDADYINFSNDCIDEVEWEKELQDEFKFGVMVDESRSFKDSFVFPKKYNYSLLEYPVRWIDELKLKEVLFEQRASDLEVDFLSAEELEKEYPTVEENT
jgi:hypothetical protein